MCQNSRGKILYRQQRFNRDSVPDIILCIVFGRRKKKRLFVLSLDGVPFSFLRTGISAGRFPNVAGLGTPVRIDSVLPPISSVAWASFSTGVNPAGHGIFGFVDRDPRTMELKLPSARDLLAPTLWTRLNGAGKRAVVMNVPLTYPPQDIDGIMISGFLCTELSRGVRPAELLPRLRKIDYRIDPDPNLGMTDRARYLEEIFATLAARRRAVFDLMREEWDFFMVHVMMTDRINHFFWADGEDPAAEYHSEFWEFYSAVDRFVGDVADSLDGDTELLLLSDHGFCRLHREVDLNAHLVEGGFLRFKKSGDGLARLDPATRAYSLLPGRIYVNLRGREGIGSVKEEDYERVRNDLIALLMELEDAAGTRVISRVYRREEVYHGSAFERAPDLIALPYDGYDLKAKFSPGDVFAEERGRTGMHTYPDAFALLQGKELADGGSILDIPPTIFSLLGVPIPVDLEGTPLGGGEK